MKGNTPDLVGHKFGRLTVAERYGTSKSKKTLWKCTCDFQLKQGANHFSITTTGTVTFEYQEGAL